MKKTKYYNIHNIVSAKITGDKKIFEQIDLHLTVFEVPELSEAPNIIIDTYDKSPAPHRSTVVDDYDYGDGIIHRKSARFWMKPQSDQQLYYMDKLILPINLIVQFALLKKGFTFIHGASVSYQGKGILMPAYPGTGKTTLICAFNRLGAKIFGDDLCILGNGTLYSYPQAFSVYPHHLAVLPYKDSKVDIIFHKSKIIKNICEILGRYNLRALKLLKFILTQFVSESVNIMPDVIFGREAIGKSTALSEVVVLERSAEIDSLVSQNVEISEISKQASIILWHEWHGSFHEILLFDAMSSSGKLFSSMLDSVARISETSFQRVTCSRVKIPASWDNKTLIDKFTVFLNVMNQQKLREY